MRQEYPGRYGARSGHGGHGDEWEHDEPGDPDWTVTLEPGGKPGRRVSRVTLAAIAVLALTVAAAVVLIAANRASSSPPPATAPGGQPAAGTLPGGGGNGGGGFVNGAGGAGGNGAGELLMAGAVTAVSSTSITLGGGAQGHTVTAAFTGATQFDGRAKNASAVKVGDAVMVEIAGYGSAHPTVKSITDPAQMP